MNMIKKGTTRIEWMNNDVHPQAEPYIVKLHDIHIDTDYADWIADIKSRYRSVQMKTDVYCSFKDISTPMGVATYNNIRIKDALPNQELLAEHVRLLQNLLRETKRIMGKTGNVEEESKISSCQSEEFNNRQIIEVMNYGHDK